MNMKHINMAAVVIATLNCDDRDEAIGALKTALQMLGSDNVDSEAHSSSVAIADSETPTASTKRRGRPPKEKIETVPEVVPEVDTPAPATVPATAADDVQQVAETNVVASLDVPAATVVDDRTRVLGTPIEELPKNVMVPTPGSILEQCGEPNPHSLGPVTDSKEHKILIAGLLRSFGKSFSTDAEKAFGKMVHDKLIGTKVEDLKVNVSKILSDDEKKHKGSENDLPF